MKITSFPDNITTSRPKNLITSRVNTCFLRHERYPLRRCSVGGKKSCTTFARKLYNIQLKVVQLFFDLSVRFAKA